MTPFIQKILFFIILICASSLCAQGSWDSNEITLARVKYDGGGDWYNDRTIIPNMLDFLRQNTNMQCALEERYVDLREKALFSYPVLFITGHGKITFSDEEAENLRNYLDSGGFLFADDDYGMDDFFREEMKKVFPKEKLVELPFSHDVFHNVYDFSNGVPKIHEHDGGPGKTFGIIRNGRLVVIYTFNTNITDGWADADVHDNPPEVREAALRFGTNVIVYALTH